MKCAHEVRAVAEGVLCAGPDGELAVGPFGNGRAGLKRGVLDISDVLGLPQHVFGLRQFIGEWFCRWIALSVVLEIIK